MLSHAGPVTRRVKRARTLRRREEETIGVWKALGSGFVGASVLTLVHETARHRVSEAPRMDVLGMRAIERIMRGAKLEPHEQNTRHTVTVAGDIVSNALYYSLVGLGSRQHVWLRGLLLGLGAGLGALVLSGPLGLRPEPSNRTNATRAMTVA